MKTNIELATEREKFKEFLTDFESDYDRKPNNFEIWQAAIEQATQQDKQRIEELERMVAMSYCSLMAMHADLIIRAKLADDDSLNVSQSILDNALEVLAATQSTAEAYDRKVELRGGVKALRDAAKYFNGRSDYAVRELTFLAAELKGE